MKKCPPTLVFSRRRAFAFLDSGEMPTCIGDQWKSVPLQWMSVENSTPTIVIDIGGKSSLPLLGEPPENYKGTPVKNGCTSLCNNTSYNALHHKCFEIPAFYCTAHSETRVYTGVVRWAPLSIVPNQSSVRL